MSRVPLLTRDQWFVQICCVAGRFAVAEIPNELMFIIRSKSRIYNKALDCCFIHCNALCLDLALCKGEKLNHQKKQPWLVLRAAVGS